MLSRNTYMEVDLNKIERNVRKIIKNNNQYQYYIGVVKADCYGLSDIKTVKSIIAGGCNYLAVATFEEAIHIRENIKNISILCLGMVPKEYLEDCIKNNITITINSLDYVEEIKNILSSEMKVHIKLNTGMNRLGISKEDELIKAYEILNSKGVDIEGIYSHIYDANNEERYNKQIEKYKKLLNTIDYKNIKIRHISASEALINYEKPELINGSRLGIIMYGFTDSKELGLESTFKLKSEVIQINELEKGETLGYGGMYTAVEKTKIAVVPIGYADGIIRKNTGRDVFINDKRYPILGNVCMDMMFIKVDNNVKVHDTVEVLKDLEHVEEVAKHLETISYEVMCSIGKRVPRIYE